MNHLVILFPGTFTLIFFLTFLFYSSYSSLRGHGRKGCVTILTLSIHRAEEDKLKITYKEINPRALFESAKES